MRHSMIFLLVIASFLVVVVGLLFLLITQARLLWEPLAPQELEALRQAVRPEPQTEMTLLGSEGILRSRWNWLAAQLFAGVLLADAKLNGRNVTLIVDSGVIIEEPILLYARAARKVGVRLTAELPTAKLSERGPEFSRFRGVADRLELGGLSVNSVPVRVVAGHYRLKSLGLPLYHVDGFIGISFLERFAATWDLHRLHLVLRRSHLPQGQELAATLHKQELEYEGERQHFYYVEGLLDGQGPYQVLIDTGASIPLLLVSNRIAQAYGQERFRVRRLEAGELVLEDLPAMEIEIEKELPFLSPDIIILGTGLLKAQGIKRLTLDFLAGKLYAER